MSNKFLLAACLAAASTVAFAGPFDQMKGKIKEGQYDTTVEMDMSGIPGMPKGMGAQKSSHSHCVTAKDIEDGKVARPSGKDGGDNCEVKDFKMSGNTASYTMVCKGAAQMTADAKMTFVSNGYDMDLKMAMNQGGQVMNMAQKIQSRHVGPCKK
jgi:hypothetical protein